MVASTSQPQSSGGSTPVPDPTILSTEALQREIEHLRELLESKIDGLESLHDEKFHSVDDKLALGERLRVEQKVDTATAVQAALAAAKEAVTAQASAFAESVAKSEGATTKQLEQIGATFKTEFSNMTTNHGDLKDRVAKIENLKIGGQESRAGLYAAIGIGISLVLAVLSVITFAAARGV